MLYADARWREIILEFFGFSADDNAITRLSSADCLDKGVVVRYAVDVSEDVQIEVDVGPGAPPLDRLTFEFDVPAERMPEMLRTFGLDAFGRDEFGRMLGIDEGERGELAGGEHVRRGIPVMRAGEVVGRATVQIRGV